MSVYSVRGNPNYSAEAIRVDQIIEYNGMDRLVGVPFAGNVALVPKGKYNVGDTVVAFPAESQLSEVVCFGNNLYSDTTKNQDPKAPKGYIGKQRRVRAIKLRGVVSSVLILDGDLFGNPDAGTKFDHVGDIEVCRKYEPPVRVATSARSNNQPKKKRDFDETVFPRHYETLQFLRNKDRLDPDKVAYITQKLHGTSVRIGNVWVKSPRSWTDRIKARLGMSVRDHYTARLVGGSRKVIKDPTDSSQTHWYATDVWSEAAKMYGDVIPPGHVVYGELVGWVSENNPIQRGYTYGVPNGEMRLVVYRVAYVDHLGQVTEFSFDAMREFCAERDLHTVPLLYHTDGDMVEVIVQANNLIDSHLAQFNYSGTKDFFFTDPAIPLCAESPCDEGIVIRQDGLTPTLLKWKSPLFLEHETKELDNGDNSER